MKTSPPIKSACPPGSSQCKNWSPVHSLVSTWSGVATVAGMVED
jgi:hypothetical protein